MMAHALGIVTILGCAVMARQAMSPPPGAASLSSPADFAERSRGTLGYAGQ